MAQIAGAQGSTQAPCPLRPCATLLAGAAMHGSAGAVARCLAVVSLCCRACGLGLLLLSCLADTTLSVPSGITKCPPASCLSSGSSGCHNGSAPTAPAAFAVAPGGATCDSASDHLHPLTPCSSPWHHGITPCKHSMLWQLWIPLQLCIDCHVCPRCCPSPVSGAARATLPDHLHPLTLPSRASRRVVRLSRAYKGRP